MNLATRPFFQMGTICPSVNPQESWVMRRGAVKLIGVPRESVELCISPAAVNARDPKPSIVEPVSEAREFGELLITNALPKDARASVTISDGDTITKDVGFFGDEIRPIRKASLQYLNVLMVQRRQAYQSLIFSSCLHAFSL